MAEVKDEATGGLFLFSSSYAKVSASLNNGSN